MRRRNVHRISRYKISVGLIPTENLHFKFYANTYINLMLMSRHGCKLTREKKRRKNETKKYIGKIRTKHFESMQEAGD